MPAGSVVETHVSRLYLSDELVVKVKKPIRTGFLDFSTAALRERACRREVELNRRLAPDAYLGVAHLPGEAGELEPAVVMRRMPADRSLEQLARSGADLGEALTSLADLLAAFHARAARSARIDRAAAPAAVRRAWTTNIEQLREVLPGAVDVARVDGLGARGLRFLAGRGPLLRARAAAGRSCDGHGDLLASDIFCPEGGAPQVLDCLEFDDALRYGDALADVAFLAMDLERCGRPDAADLLVASYRRAARDDWPVSLLAYYVAHRAAIRAKVACIRLAQGERSAAADVALHLEIADRHLRAGAVRLVLVGGLPGTGKTTLAHLLADAEGWACLSSDVRRKELAGVPATARGADLYDRATTDRTYRSLLASATEELALGRSVVLDATWGAARHRTWAERAAARAQADLVCVQAVLPEAVVAQRLAAREAEGRDASDADLAVHRLLAAQFAPWPVTTIDMQQSAEQALAAARLAAGAS